jgi:hypothetical protein
MSGQSESVLTPAIADQFCVFLISATICWCHAKQALTFPSFLSNLLFDQTRKKIKMRAVYYEYARLIVIFNFHANAYTCASIAIQIISSNKMCKKVCIYFCIFFILLSCSLLADELMLY